MGISKEENARLRDSESKQLCRLAQPISQFLKRVSSRATQKGRYYWRKKGSYLALMGIVTRVMLLLLTSCTSVRPVMKIGLLAPVEGLHRQQGYAALTAMRQAIADYAPTTVAIMPLALDNAADPSQTERAVRKLLQDSSVRAVVGPDNPLLVGPVQRLLADRGIPWLMPLALDPARGFVPPDRDGAWALPLLAATAATAQQAGQQRLVLAGWTPGWPQLPEQQLRSAFTLPLVLSDEVTVVQPTDAVVWLGSPEAGALYFAALRTLHPALPFFLGPQADSPIFSEHVQISGPVYLLFWVDDGYEQWRVRAEGQPPTAYLTYRATQQAIALSIGQAWPQSQGWRLQVVAVTGAQRP
jgi:hypothetical protein